MYEASFDAMKTIALAELLREAEAAQRNGRHQRRLVLGRAGKTGQHAGGGWARRDDVHADSSLGNLERHRFDKAFDGVLADRSRERGRVNLQAVTSPVAT